MEAIIFNFENGEIDKGQKNVQISTGESSCKGQVSNRRLQSRDQREFDRRPQTLTREIIQMRLKREVYCFKKHRNCHQQAVIVTTNSNSHRNCHQNLRNCHHFSSDKTETIIEASDEDEEDYAFNLEENEDKNMGKFKSNSKPIMKEKKKKQGKKKSRKHRRT